MCIDCHFVVPLYHTYDFLFFLTFCPLSILGLGSSRGSVVGSKGLYNSDSFGSSGLKSSLDRETRLEIFVVEGWRAFSFGFFACTANPENPMPLGLGGPDGNIFNYKLQQQQIWSKKCPSNASQTRCFMWKCQIKSRQWGQSIIESCRFRPNIKRRRHQNGFGSLAVHTQSIHHHQNFSNDNCTKHEEAGVDTDPVARPAHFKEMLL